MLFILAEKRKQKDSYVNALKGRVKHINPYLDEVIDSKTRPDKPRILLSYLQGHAYELVDAKDYNKDWRNWALKYLPIFPKVFKHRLSYGFKKTSGGRYHMDILNKVVDKCNEMWLGSDPDVEGEGLIYEPIDINHWRDKIKITGRIWINHGLTVSGMSKTLKHDVINPAKTRSHATASHAREIADWLIGINISRLATDIARKYGYRGTFTAGRVQTPTLALITARRNQREAFKPVTSYHLAFLDKNGMNFLGSQKGADGKEEKAQFKTRADAENVAKSLGGAPIVNDVQNKIKHQSAPKLPKTSDMEGYLVSHAHISSKQALNKIMEPMYDRYSAQTYPRTECNLITTDDFSTIKSKLPQYKHLYEQIIGHELPKGLFTNLKPRRKYVDFTGKKVQKQGHGAITVDPENKVMTIAQYRKLSKPERIDYKFVLGSTLSMFADDHAYRQLKIEAKADKYSFRASNKSSVHNDTDWKQLFPWLENGKKREAEVPVSDYENSKPLTPSKKHLANDGYYGKAETTTPPTAITEANLVKKIMPKFNLGTSSTRPNIIDSLKHTKLIVSAKKKVASRKLKRGEFMPTQKGIVCLQLLRYSHLLNLAKVSSWENQMKSIMSKKLSYDDFVNGIKKDITDDVKTMPNHDYKFTIKPHKSRYSNISKKATDVTCPKCKGGKLQLLSMDMALPNKKIVHIGFYTCSRKSCHFSVSANLSGMQVTPSVLRQIFAGTLPEQHLMSKRGTPFKAKFVYYRGKVRYKFPSRFKEVYNFKCPKCKRGKIGFISGKVKGGKNKGKPYALYACTNPKCKFVQFQTVARVKLTPQMVKEACNDKMPWTQFTKKNGDPMIAKLGYYRGKLKMKFKN